MDTDNTAVIVPLSLDHGAARVFGAELLRAGWFKRNVTDENYTEAMGVQSYYDNLGKFEVAYERWLTLGSVDIIAGSDVELEWREYISAFVPGASN